MARKKYPDKRTGTNVTPERTEQVRKATAARNEWKELAARDAGWGSWRKFETAVKNGIVELPRKPTNQP